MIAQPGDAAVQASLRPVRHGGRRFWLVILALAALVAAALFAWGWQLTHGLGGAGYNDQAFWAVYEANLVAFIGLSYGGAVVSAILRLTGASWRAPLTRIAEATAVATLLVGMAFALVHLGRPERIWELVVTPNLSSPIVWDFVAISTYLLATLIFFYLPLIPDLALARNELGEGSWRYRLYGRLARQWEGTPAQRRILHRALGIVAVMIIPLAVSVHSVLSWAFALTSRPGWDSSIFAPYFVIAALYSGVALVILVVAGFRRAYHLEAFITEKHFVRLGYIMAALGATYLYLTFADMLNAGYVGEGGAASLLAQLLTGQYAISFWLFVFGGCIVPLLLISIPATRRLWGVLVAAALIVAGLWLKRMLIVVPAATQPLVAGGWGVYHFTWVPLLITLGAAAAIPLQLLLIFRVVPVMSPVEIEELAQDDVSASEIASVRLLATQGAK
jgi:molybdopterin-containing oxidoreductase family membrane subunit